MKKTKEEIIEHFKNAKRVACAIITRDEVEFNPEELKLSSDTWHIGNVIVWSVVSNRFGEIITYKNKEEMENLIGKKVKGFKFENNKFEYISYTNSMDIFVGAVGVIEDENLSGNGYIVSFGSQSWSYPKELIMEHLVERGDVLSLEGARAIIDVACSTWKEKLTKLWGAEMLMNSEVVISKEFYNEMIKESNQAQEKVINTYLSFEKSDNWRDEAVGSCYITLQEDDGLLKAAGNDDSTEELPLHFKSNEEAGLLADKCNLMIEMWHFANVHNNGWKPNWNNDSKKYGVEKVHKGVGIESQGGYNSFVFGIAVKSIEIANKMLEEFKDKIEEVYNKQ